ncbi:MAG: polyisoprenoid-binding protein YceI [Bacteroidia bacterium]|jgi:polyisoprenoid-binding protein YceI
MTKKIKNFGLALIGAFTLLSFTMAVSGTDYTILTDKSNVKWTGYKPAGEHKGLVNIKSGTLNIQDDLIQTGNFVLDMPSIKVTDSESPKLLKHLKGEDFFDVKKYTTSTLVIDSSRSVSSDTSGKHTLEIFGDLTIRGKTLPITFTAKNTAKTDNYMFYTANITLDRTKYGIVYKSSLLGDAMIKDNFDLAIKIIAKKN